MYADGILFDLDGTLWDSAKEVVYTWNEVLKSRPGLRPPITVAEEQGLMGQPMDRLAQQLFPMLEQDERESLMDACCAYENEYLAQHGATLYPSLEETLSALRPGKTLAVVSNCQSGYIESFLTAHHLKSYFADTECFGNTGLYKGQNIRLVVKRNGLQAPVYVGDTQGDADAAREAGVPFVFAAYGFGTVDQYDAKIQTVAELLNLIE